MIATLKSIKRNFGSDSATYKAGDDTYIVNVGWALLSPFVTKVFKNDEEVAVFDDPRYIQPPEALSRLGLDIIGIVDFASKFSL